MYFIDEYYSIADFATDIYTTFNDAYIQEPNVEQNIFVIPTICNLMVKRPQEGVYFGVWRDISLMQAGEKGFNTVDIEIHLYEKTVNKGGIPFNESHADIRTARQDKQVDETRPLDKDNRKESNNLYHFL